MIYSTEEDILARLPVVCVPVHRNDFIFHCPVYMWWTILSKKDYLVFEAQRKSDEQSKYPYTNIDMYISVYRPGGKINM